MFVSLLSSLSLRNHRATRIKMKSHLNGNADVRTLLLYYVISYDISYCIMLYHHHQQQHYYYHYYYYYYYYCYYYNYYYYYYHYYYYYYIIIIKANTLFKSALCCQLRCIPNCNKYIAHIAISST